MTELEKGELADLVEKTMGDKDSIKEAVDTLHPKKSKKEFSKQSDGLAILDHHQIDACAVLEWEDRAMSMTSEEFSSMNLTEGFVDKVKGLTPSIDGVGRREIPEVMQPKVIGDMLQQGLVPMPSAQQPIQQKKGFMARLFGRQ